FARPARSKRWRFGRRNGGTLTALVQGTEVEEEEKEEEEKEEEEKEEEEKEEEEEEEEEKEEEEELITMMKERHADCFVATARESSGEPQLVFKETPVKRARVILSGYDNEKGRFSHRELAFQDELELLLDTSSLWDLKALREERLRVEREEREALIWAREDVRD
ncbi:MAG: hypothetical protein Q9184_006838, partial [Pyrenodesmia sp. 2 TL-2023]